MRRRGLNQSVDAWEVRLVMYTIIALLAVIVVVVWP